MSDTYNPYQDRAAAQIKLDQYNNQQNIDYMNSFMGIAPGGASIGMGPAAQTSATPAASSAQPQNGPYKATQGSGQGMGGQMAYTDKELFAMQAALNEAAKVKQDALTRVQERTDKTVTGNIDYFKQLTDQANKMLAPYQAMAAQGSQFYMNAIGANGPAAQQATLPQASDIFKRNSIDATSFLSSIPNWSFNQASNQASNFMNNMFGYGGQQQQQTNNQQQAPRSGTQQTTQYRNWEAPATQQQQGQTPNNAFTNAQPSFQTYTDPKTLAAQEAKAKAQSDYEAQLAALTAKQGSYQSDVESAVKNSSNQSQRINNLIEQVHNVNTRSMATQEDVDLLTSLGLRGVIRPTAGYQGGYINQSSVDQALKQLYEEQAKYGSNVLTDTTLPEGYGKSYAQLHQSTAKNGEFVNPYDKQIADLKAQYTAQNPQTPAPQANTGALNQFIGQSNTPLQAATLNAPQANTGPNQAMQGLLSPFLAEMNNRPDMDPNTILNKLIDPATGAVNNWMNSDVVKNVMDTTVGAGTNAVQNAQAARGMLDSGQTLAELQKVGTNAAGQYIVPYAGQLANTVLNQGANIANNRLSNYYQLLGKGADFANSMMQTQAAMTQGLAGQYNTLAGNTLNNLQNNASQQAISQGNQQLTGAMNLMNQGQQAATNTANAYTNLAGQSAAQNIYGNDIYGNNQLQSANIEANRLSQYQQLQMQLDRANAAQKANNFGMMFNGAGTLLGLGMMAAGGGL